VGNLLAVGGALTHLVLALVFQVMKMDLLTSLVLFGNMETNTIAWIRIIVCIMSIVILALKLLVVVGVVVFVLWEMRMGLWILLLGALFGNIDNLNVKICSVKSLKHVEDVHCSEILAILKDVVGVLKWGAMKVFLMVLLLIQKFVVSGCGQIRNAKNQHVHFIRIVQVVSMIEVLTVGGVRTKRNALLDTMPCLLKTATISSMAFAEIHVSLEAPIAVPVSAIGGVVGAIMCVPEEIQKRQYPLKDKVVLLGNMEVVKLENVLMQVHAQNALERDVIGVLNARPNAAPYFHLNVARSVATVLIPHSKTLSTAYMLSFCLPREQYADFFSFFRLDTQSKFIIGTSDIITENFLEYLHKHKNNQSSRLITSS